MQFSACYDLTLTRFTDLQEAYRHLALLKRTRVAYKGYDDDLRLVALEGVDSSEADLE